MRGNSGKCGTGADHNIVLLIPASLLHSDNACQVMDGPIRQVYSQESASGCKSNRVSSGGPEWVNGSLCPWEWFVFEGINGPHVETPDTLRIQNYIGQPAPIDGNRRRPGRQ